MPRDHERALDGDGDGDAVASSSSTPWPPLETRELERYRDRFDALRDDARADRLRGDRVVSELLDAGLERATLKKLWDLADADEDGDMTLDEFVVAMYLADRAKRGTDPPASLGDLPSGTFPPSFSSLHATTTTTRPDDDDDDDDDATATTTARARATPPPRQMLDRDDFADAPSWHSRALPWIGRRRVKSIASRAVRAWHRHATTATHHRAFATYAIDVTRAARAIRVLRAWRYVARVRAVNRAVEAQRDYHAALQSLRAWRDAVDDAEDARDAAAAMRIRAQDATARAHLDAWRAAAARAATLDAIDRACRVRRRRARLATTLAAWSLVAAEAAVERRAARRASVARRRALLTRTTRAWRAETTAEARRRAAGRRVATRVATAATRRALSGWRRETREATRARRADATRAAHDARVRGLARRTAGRRLRRAHAAWATFVLMRASAWRATLASIARVRAAGLLAACVVAWRAETARELELRAATAETARGPIRARRAYAFAAWVAGAATSRRDVAEAEALKARGDSAAANNAVLDPASSPALFREWFATDQLERRDAKRARRAFNRWTRATAESARVRRGATRATRRLRDFYARRALGGWFVAMARARDDPARRRRVDAVLAAVAAEREEMRAATRRANDAVDAARREVDAAEARAMDADADAEASRDAMLRAVSAIGGGGGKDDDDDDDGGVNNNAESVRAIVWRDDVARATRERDAAVAVAAASAASARVAEAARRAAADDAARAAARAAAAELARAEEASARESAEGDVVAAAREVARAEAAVQAARADADAFAAGRDAARAFAADAMEHLRVVAGVEAETTTTRAAATPVSSPAGEFGSTMAPTLAHALGVALASSPATASSFDVLGAASEGHQPGRRPRADPAAAAAADAARVAVEELAAETRAAEAARWRDAVAASRAEIEEKEREISALTAHNRALAASLMEQTSRVEALELWSARLDGSLSTATKAARGEREEMYGTLLKLRRSITKSRECSPISGGAGGERSTYSTPTTGGPAFFAR